MICFSHTMRDIAVPRLDALVTATPVDQVAIWVVLAFCVWLVLTQLVRRLQVPNPILVAATLSWIVAWLFIWSVPMVLHDVSSWALR